MSCTYWCSGSCLTNGDICAACAARLPVWIPCSERMPEPGVEVLVVRRDAQYDIGPTLYLGTHDPKGGYHIWRTAVLDLEADEVPCWMPLPPLPEA